MSLKSGRPAVLLLEDGTSFYGTMCAGDGEVFGEICFNTSLTGYQEIISDPSYAGQIITMTYPHIGNYGVNAEDMQSRRLFCQGLVVRDMCTSPSNFRSSASLPEFLERSCVLAIEGVDTRRLVRHIREHGALKAALSSEIEDMDALRARLDASAGLVGRNLVKEVSIQKASTLPPYKCAKKYRVVVYDCGVKTGILSALAQRGCELVCVPWNSSVDYVLSKDPDGIFFSNGPGDPQAVKATYKRAAALIGKKPIFGICLGHQMLSLAAGCQIEKLKYGHHGGNQPVMNLLTGACEITAQNHGFGQIFPSMGPLIPELSGGVREHVSDLRYWCDRHVAPVVQSSSFGRIMLTHVNLNDGTPEGMVFLDKRAFSVQYHPEACPGPHDSSYLFDAFCRLMDGEENYLALDLRDRRRIKQEQKTCVSETDEGV